MIGAAFDLSGTLVRDAGLERAACVDLLRRLSDERRSSFDEAAASALWDASERTFATQHERAPDASYFVGAVRAFLGEPAAARVVLSLFRQIAMQLVPGRIEPLPRARETLAQIGSLGVPCAILTNGWSSIEQRKATQLGFAGPVLVSEDIGCRKPQEAAFAALSRALGLPPDRIWYVADDPEDIAGAARAGLHTVWLRPSGAAFPSEFEAPEHAIERVDEVLALLAEPYARSLLGLRYVLHSTLSWRPGHFVPGAEYGLNAPASLEHVMPAPKE